MGDLENTYRSDITLIVILQLFGVTLIYTLTFGYIGH